MSDCLNIFTKKQFCVLCGLFIFLLFHIGIDETSSSMKGKVLGLNFILDILLVYELW